MKRSLTPQKPAPVPYAPHASLARLRSRIVAPLLATALAASALVAVATPVAAEVRHVGEWPAATAEKKVTLTFEKTPRRLAIKKLADAAGWSVVVPSDVEDPIDVSVKDQPASKVLDLMLHDGEFVAKRDGTMIFIARAGANGAGAGAVDPSAPGLVVPNPMGAMPPVPPVPATPPEPGVGPVPPVPPMPPIADFGKHGKKGKHGKSQGDRVVAGSMFKLDKGESVDDLTVFGGAADIFGTVNGDVAVIGGSTRVHEGAVVHGDAVAVGGSLTVDDGARVDGDLGAVGGTVHRGEKAIIGGKVKATAGLPGAATEKGADPSDQADEDDDDSDKSPEEIAEEARGKAEAARAQAEAAATTAGNIAAKLGHDHHDHDDEAEEHVSGPLRAVRALMHGMTIAAMLFVFGCVFLALATKRMDALKLEAAVRPMRTFALGVVGSIAGVVIFCALCITIIGIPVACIGLSIALFGAYAGVCSVLTMVGEVLLRHRTQNPYVHLATGCALLTLVGAIPWIGGLVTTVVVLMGIGCLVSTRGAGLVPLPKTATPAGPYRTASTTEAL